MMEIIYRGNIYSYKYSNNMILAGMVATFVGDRGVDLCTDQTIPIGFFMTDAIPPLFMPSSSHLSVMVGQAELRTDIFEESYYKITDFLYCSVNGKITNESRYRGNIIIGIVNDLSEDKIGFITCLARGLEKDPIEQEHQIVQDRYSLLKINMEKP
jgi:hypothetical protein